MAPTHTANEVQEVRTMVSDDGSQAFFSVLRPVVSAAKNPVVMQLKIQHNDGEEEEEEGLQMFETYKASICATTLEFLATVPLVIISYANSTHTRDWVSVAAWHAAVWSLPHFLVNRPKNLVNDLGVYGAILVLVLQPHMDICRRIPYLGAVHGSASCMSIIRSLQFYWDQESFNGWSRWRRMFFISAYGWHDLRHAKYVKSQEECDNKLMFEARRIGKWFSVLMATVVFHKFILGGNPYTGLTFREAFEKLAIKGDFDMFKYFALRWGVGYWTLLSWFYCMDAFAKGLHFWATRHELRSISEDPFSATTLKEFWGKRWNIPVQDMLVQGVYLPISRMKWLPFRKLIAKLMVFIVSGAGHTYAISCGGSPWSHLAAMFSFFMVQIPLIAAEDALGMNGMVWMLASEMPFAPLFIEPCLSFCHL